jgi:hypothetical protein
MSFEGGELVIQGDQVVRVYISGVFPGVVC